MIARLATVAVFLSLIQPALARADDAEVRYQTLLKAAQSDPASVDWQALRFAYADRPGTNVVDDGLGPLRKTMITARQTHDWTQLLSSADEVITKDYVDGQAHLYASVASRVLGKADDADREQRIAVAIFKSIQTGDGLSPASAFTVISIPEEYELIAAMQRRVKGQSLISKDGHQYDALATTGTDGAEKTYYFLIDRVWAAESKMFAPISTPK